MGFVLCDQLSQWIFKDMPDFETIAFKSSLSAEG